MVTDTSVRRPTLLNSCSMAATSAEARYRIDYPIQLRRASRIVALDAEAAEIVSALADYDWGGAHFFTFSESVPSAGPQGPLEDARLRAPDGSEALLSDELEDADVVVMVATADGSAEAASVIGQACAARMIMPAGLILDQEGAGVEEAIAALRPYAMVLTILKEGSDIAAVLSALRA
jgi:hypothetical protein